ncbi:MAG: hypothetical protein HZA54_05365 [Planctomycetes bacterium]|nr:hypothetical protein [Planctomycetota bacterium]
MITPRSARLLRYGPYLLAVALLGAAYGALAWLDRKVDETTEREDAARSTAAAAPGALFAVRARAAVLNRFPERFEISGVNPFAKPPPDQYLMEYLSSILLGGFKAIAVDYLWVRAIKLQNEKKFEEIPLLLDAIVRLQPKQAEIWIHNAWNMAYNIAAQCDSPREKWKWVKQALDYLEAGLKTNPQNPNIEFWIGYIYWHRIPQDDNLVELCFNEFQKDPFELAEHWLGVAQSHNLTKGQELDVYHGLVSDAMYRRAFFFAGRGRIDEANQELDKNAAYCRRMAQRYLWASEFWLRRVDWMQWLHAPFELERAWAAAIDPASGRELVGEALEELGLRVIDAYRRVRHDSERFTPKPMVARERTILFHLVEKLLKQPAGVALDDPTLAPRWKRLQEGCTQGQDPADPFLGEWKGTREVLEAVQRSRTAVREADAKAAAAVAAGAAGPAEEARAAWRAQLEKLENLLAVHDYADRTPVVNWMNEIRSQRLGMAPDTRERTVSGGSVGQD